MKRNAFGDAYCQTAAEARQEIENSDNGWNVYLGEIEPPEPPRFGATGSVLENRSGDLVCYIEAPDADGVRAIAAELKLEVS